MKKIFIIGGGIAALEAAKSARSTQRDALIVLISAENFLPYSRPMLTKQLMGKVTAQDLAVESAAWYDEKDIVVLTGRTVTAIDPVGKTLVAGGTPFHWDSLILATGASCFVPPIPGADGANVVAVRTFGDVVRVREIAKTAKNAAVIGGGLGVDYEGTRSQSDCSVNYGLNEYANNIIWAIGDACEENGLPHPTVITESGRAVTAHHTVLVSNIIGVERNEYTVPTAPAEDAPRALQSMWETWQEMHEPGTRRSLREWLHDSQMDLHDIHIGYSSGIFSLQERAWAEQLYLSMCHEVQKQLDPQNRAHRPIIDELQERMADKMYVNFSLFQSMPDAWGIDQLFPVLPLEGLDQVPERRAVLLDITCDSDGAIDHYIDGDGIATTMPMPEYDPENPPMLGFFMVGAYQEILGNMHNLFGDTEAVDVFVFPDGSVEVELSDEGDTVADMLQYVQLDPKTLLTQFRDQVKKTDLDAELQQQFLEEFEAGLYGYTYLEDE